MKTELKEFKNPEGLKIIDTSLLHEAINKWGVDAQVEMIIEECLELALTQ